MITSACAVGGHAQATDWSQQSSASSGGGLTQLVKAAKREGELTLAVRPGDSAGWLANMVAFQQKYGIQLTIVTTDTTDAAQVADAKRLDVLDLSPDVADAKKSLLAPYVVFYWVEIPSALKQPKAYWYDDCGAFMAIGFDATKVAAVTSVAGLLNPGLTGAVALPGDPRTDEAGLAAVVMASVANGGSASDPAPGVDFIHRVREAGNLGVWGASGPPPVLIDWDFAEADLFPNNHSWSYVVPADGAVAAYRAQAVSRYAAHPAAARLWEEYLFSDTGQNACLRLGARPARMDAMSREGTLDVAAAAALYPVGSKAVVLTAADLAAARAYVDSHWASAVAE